MRRFPLVKQLIATSLVALLIAPAVQAAPAPQQPGSLSPQVESTEPAPAPQQYSAIPDAPLPQETPLSAAQNTPAPNPDPQQTSPATPIGTAAAPAEAPVGTTGSRPAGAVIAPAKQKRVRTILISVALVVGAGVAIGTVAALSHASPSQPH